METPFATPDAKSCFCFPSLWQSKRKKPNFFAKNDSGKTLAEVTEKTLQDQRGRKEDLERITSGYGTQLRINRRIQAGLLSKTEGLDKCAQKIQLSNGRKTDTANEPLAINRIRIFYAAIIYTETLNLGKQLFCYDFDKFLLSSL